MSYDWQGVDRPFAPSAARNQAPILAVLKRHFSGAQRVLEIGSGTGQHAVHFAPQLPQAIWQTSDVADKLPGIRAWLDEARLPNLPPPLVININAPWPQPALRYDAAFTANTLHIVSWPEVQMLFGRLGEVLAQDAFLAVYGPFNQGGQFSSQSNRDFDESLRQQSAASGIRNLEDVDTLAQSVGFRLIENCAMPANNRLLVWKRGH